MTAETKILLPAIADADALAGIQILSFRQTYKGILPDDYLNRLDAEAIRQDFIQKISDPEKLLVIAHNGDSIAGYAYISAQRMEELPFSAELIELYLHPAYTGKGIGKQIFQHITAVLADRGWTSFNVWALCANKGACGFYEAMGGMKLIEGGIYWPGIDGHTFEAACYYWT